MTLGNQEFGFVSVADVRWGGVNLAVVPWTRIPDSPPRERLKWVMLGDEREARGKLDRNGRKKPEILRFDELEAATRANRQLATILRDQGLNDEANRFAYQAQVLQRWGLLRERRFGPALGS